MSNKKPKLLKDLPYLEYLDNLLKYRDANQIKDYWDIARSTLDTYVMLGYLPKPTLRVHIPNKTPMHLWTKAAICAHKYERKRQVIACLANGKSYQEIAKLANISLSQVIFLAPDFSEERELFFNVLKSGAKCAKLASSFNSSAASGGKH